MATSGQLTWERLVAIARRVGVKVIEAPSSHRGKLGRMGSVVGTTEHTTGTPNSYRPADDYPDYNVVKEGRAGLVNSLSAYGIGRRDAIYVFSEFLSWHAGTWSWAGITDGNGHFLGIECAGVGDYTEFQRKVYPRLVAAILLDIGAPRSMAPRHLDGAVPKGRKVDAQNFDGNFYQGKSFNQWVDFFLANPAHININYGGDDMPLSDDDLRKLHDAVWHGASGAKLVTNYRTNQGEWAGTTLGALEARLTNESLAPKVIAALQGQISGLIDAIRQLAAAPGQDVDLTAVTAAAREGAKLGVADGIEGIDVTVKVDNDDA